MPKPYLISYDVANARRLVRVHRCLKSYAVPIQYSVFFGALTAAMLDDCIGNLTRLIEPDLDDIRLYPLPAHGWMRRLGLSPLPPGVNLTLLPEPWSGLMNGQPTAEPSAPRALGDIPALSRKERGAATTIQSRVQTGQTRGIFLLR